MEVPMYLYAEERTPEEKYGTTLSGYIALHHPFSIASLSPASFAAFDFNHKSMAAPHHNRPSPTTRSPESEAKIQTLHSMKASAIFSSDSN